MQNLTIKAKLIASFALLLLAVVILGGASLDRISAVNKEAVAVRDNWLPSVGAIGKLAAQAERKRIFDFRMILARSEEDITAAEKSAQAAAADVEKAYATYEPLITKGTDDEKLMADFRDAWKKYQAINETTAALMHARDFDKAHTVLNNDGKKAFDTIRKILIDDVTFNTAEGQKAGKLGEEVYNQTIVIIWVVIGIAILIAIGLSLYVIANVSKPLTAMTKAMENLGKGDKTITVPGLDRADEIGHMAHALQVFKDTALEADRLAAIASQDQEAKAARQKKIEGAVSVFDREIRGAMSQLASAATEMRSTAQSMSATAEETSRQSSAVAAASEEASASVSTVASAAEELSASITEIQRQTEASQKTADQAVEQAKNTEETVRSLETATTKIGEVVNLINDIAGQTNLLALNATIEAARAGEAGKGFAVVASEVKNLASQTAKATDEVAAQINAMQTATRSVVDAIQRISTTISHMNQMAGDVARIVQQQGDAVHEIAHNAQQASAGTQEVSSNIVGVNQAASQTGSAASQVLETSKDLSTQSEKIKTEVDSFLHDIQEA